MNRENLRGMELKGIKFILKGIVKLIVVIAVIQIGRAYLFVNNDLKLMPWHGVSEVAELDYDTYEDVESYLRDEEVFLEERYQEVEVKEKGLYNRYIRESGSSPYGYLDTDVNASFEMIPEDIKGGVLMLHGLTDSPYSMRDVAKTFYDKGYYVLALRYPYHGTYPGELLKLSWKDFTKTARFGARMVKKKLEGIEGSKFYMMGYSTGATTTLQYIVHDMKEDRELPRPDGVFWLSPAMGVNPAAKFGFLDIITSKIPGFEKFAWLDIYPEYDMAKYNSFAKNPGIQVYNIIKNSRDNLSKLSEEERRDLPPVYAYTSIQDATVDATELFKVVKEMGNSEGEITIFDANRKYNDFYKPWIKEIDFERGIRESGIVSDVVVVSNMRNKTDEVSIVRVNNGKATDEGGDLNLKWAGFTFCLAHISLPISPENPIYGRGTLLGELSIKGEKGIVTVSPDMLLRLRYNEFFDYIERSIEEKID